MLETLEIKVTQMLARALDEQLLAHLCETLGIQVGGTDNKQKLYKKLIRFVHSEELEDLGQQGQEILQALLETLNAAENADQKTFIKVEQEVKSQSEEERPDFENFEAKIPDIPVDRPNLASTKIAEPEVNQTTTTVIKRLKDFKINGSIGKPGQKDKLAFTSLAYQVQNGISDGYSDSEICGAVIKAITPGLELRNYLETTEFLDVRGMLAILRNYFKEKDATSYFKEMANSFQKSDETANDFLMRLMSLRQRVLVLAKEENYPYSPVLVQKQFLKALKTGLKSNNIRLELKESLDAEYISDEVLLENMSVALANEQERTSKSEMKQTVNAIVSEKINSKTPKVNPLVAQVEELTACVKTLSNLQSTVTDLKTQVSKMAAGNSTHTLNNSRQPKRIMRCPNCRVRKTRCTHCFYCGDDNHRRGDCPHLRPGNDDSEN